ncbi:MAG: hypothetical protein OEZ43_22050 [Gammaproteobacteria bacterium]|nr:hypothetical protein [Gammaproteobacteria bacterium]
MTELCAEDSGSWKKSVYAFYENGDMERSEYSYSETQCTGSKEKVDLSTSDDITFRFSYREGGESELQGLTATEIFIKSGNGSGELRGNYNISVDRLCSSEGIRLGPAGVTLISQISITDPSGEDPLAETLNLTDCLEKVDET